MKKPAGDGGLLHVGLQENYLQAAQKRWMRRQASSSSASEVA
jgi:hypothetical protein